MRYSFAILALMMSACAPIDASHPIDPATPRDKLPKATIEAFLRPPPRFDTELLLNVMITLTPVEDGYRTLETRADEAGAFVFEDITPGTYRLYCQGNGVESDPVLVDVIAGSVIELGEILLVPLVGTIRGTAFTVTGEAASGAIISADDNFDSTIADAEGRFTLQVYAGRRILTIANPDHFTWASAPISVAGNEETVLEDPIFIIPFNGNLQGAIGLKDYETETRLMTARLELRPQDTEPGAQRFVRDTRVVRRDMDPDEQGLFTLNNIIPGAYYLIIRANAYESNTHPVVIEPNRTATLDLLELNHDSKTVEAVTFSGRLRTGLVGLSAVAVTMEIVEATERIHYGTFVTDNQGRFSVQASPDEEYFIKAELVGFRDLNAGPYRYDAELGFVDRANEAPEFNLSPSSN